MFNFNSGGDGLGKMQNALIRGGYDKSYVFRLNPTQVIDLYDSMYGSGEGKDYSAPTPKMEGGPVKLAEGETIKGYETGPSALGKVFSRFRQPPGEEVIDKIRKEAKTYYFNALLPKSKGTGSYSMEQMEAADKRATELAEVDVIKYLENFKEPTEDPILKYRDRFSEDDEYGFPAKVLRDEMRFGSKLLDDPKFFGPNSMLDMDAYDKVRFGADAPTNKYLMSLPEETRDAVMKKYIARDAELDIQRAENRSGEYMKRRYGLAEGGMPNTTENVGIMDGVGIGAEAIMKQEQSIDQAEDLGGLMSAIRGRPVDEKEARNELAELVGAEDAQQTPESVLALVQPVMELSKGSGIAQFVEEAEMPEAKLAKGGPVRMAIGGTQDYRGSTIPDLRAAYEQQFPIVQDILGQEQDMSGLKSDILFQIAAGGLDLARQRKPGESSDPITMFSESFKQPLLNVGALSREARINKQKEDQALKGTALGLAQDVIAGEKAEVDADIELASTLAKAQKEAEERDEDLMKETTVYYNNLTNQNEVLSDKDVIDIQKNQGSAYFTENFLPKKDLKVGSYEVIDRQSGDAPSLAPTGRMDLVFDSDQGKYFYRQEGTNVLTELPSDITVSAAVSSTATAKDTTQLGGKVNKMYIDAFGGINQVGTGVVYLDDLYETSMASGAQLGFVAGLKKKFQSFASAAEDIGVDVLPIYNDLLDLTNQEKTEGFDNVVNQSLQQQEQDIFQLKQDQLNGKTLSDDDLKALEDENAMKSYLSGRSHVVRNKETGALEIQALPPSFIDEDLFKNAVKINSLIYSVARARKPTGRLNVDDIKKASEAIQIYQGGERGVQAALRAVREELADAGQGKVKELIQVDATRAQYDPIMANFGVTETSFNAYKNAYIEQLSKTKEGEYTNISALPSIYGGYSEDGYSNPLENNFQLKGTGPDNTESMESFIESYAGGKGNL